jgi:hypothetical protein
LEPQDRQESDNLGAPCDGLHGRTDSPNATRNEPVKWGAPKEPLPRPVKSFYNDDPNLPTTDGILDSDLQQPDSGFRRKIEYSRRR